MYPSKKMVDGFYYAAAPSAALHSCVHALKTCAAIWRLPPVLYSTSALLCLFYKRCEAASRVQLKHPFKTSRVGGHSGWFSAAEETNTVK